MDNTPLQKVLNTNTFVILFMAGVSIFFRDLYVIQPWWDIAFFFMFALQVALLVIHVKRTVWTTKKHEYVFLNRVDMREELYEELAAKMPEPLKPFAKQIIQGEMKLQGKVFPPPNIPEELYFRYRFKCIHCEEISQLPPPLIQILPKQMAMCPYGVKPRLKEMIGGIYDCLLEEEIEQEQEESNERVADDS